jgi:3-phenylpropionate/cinnamic acid dioxygenase small subunit
VIDSPSADAPLVFEVTRFLTWEALLLDEGRYAEWLALLAPDIHYVVATRSAQAAEGPRSPLTVLDEDHRSLSQRIERFALGGVWAETPPSLTQRIVSNVLVQPVRDAVDLLEVHSAIVLHRTRLEREVEQFVGRRDDVLRRTATGLRLARRRVTLAANALPGKNLSVFL